MSEDADRAMAEAERRAEINEQHRDVRIDGEVVTRPAGAGTATVHAYLRHLRAAGLTCVPEPLGVEDGVERLAFLSGESGGDGWFHQHDDAGLASAARLLRRIHDAGRDWVPPSDAVFGAPAVPGEDLVFCHGDPGPWNFVWRDGEAVGLVDWDYLHPAPRLDDVAYALEWFGPLRRDEFVLEWHHFPVVPDRRHRVRVFLEAYGDLPAFDVAEAVAGRMEAVSALMADLAARGVEPQRTWVAEGALAEREAEIDWVRDHRALFA